MPYDSHFSLDSVIVVESLRSGERRTATDLYDTTIAPHVFEQRLVGELYEPRTRAEFFGTLDAVRRVAAAGHSPLLHLEAHGDEDGLQVGSGELIGWTELAPALARINQAARMNLLVVAASCNGWHLTRSLSPVGRSPVWAVLGPPSTVPGDGLHEAMKRFYSQLLPSLNVMDALRALNQHSDIESWAYRMISADILYCQAFREYMRSLRDEESQVERVNRLVADFARSRDADLVQTAVARAEFTEALENHGYWYEKYKTHFLMLDLFPENAARFPLTLSDCLPGSV